MALKGPFSGSINHSINQSINQSRKHREGENRDCNLILLNSKWQSRSFCGLIAPDAYFRSIFLLLECCGICVLPMVSTIRVLVDRDVVRRVCWIANWGSCAITVLSSTNMVLPGLWGELCIFQAALWRVSWMLDLWSLDVKYHWDQKYYSQLSYFRASIRIAVTVTLTVRKFPGISWLTSTGPLQLWMFCLALCSFWLAGTN